MHCDRIRYKCKVKTALIDPLYELRSKDILGSIGPAQFSDPATFLRDVSIMDKTRSKWKFKNDEVCAFGDIHGDFLVLLSVLTMMRLIDDAGDWTGGSTLVVFCGDLLDRAGRSKTVVGTNTREEVDIIQYLYYLNIQSLGSGGGVVTILGNHELGRVFWKDPIFQKYSRFRGAQSIGWGDDMEMFQPGGLMGRYIARFFPVIVKCKNFIFMHGGPKYGLVENCIRRRRGKTRCLGLLTGSPGKRCFLRVLR
jgi:hypothetical protein